MTQNETLIVQPPPPIAQITPMSLIQLALSNNAAIDVIERLTALQEKAMAREAEIDFNDALNRVQEEIKRVAADLDNPQTKSRYASYAALDRVVRPIYSKERFSLSFNTSESPKPDHVRVLCYVSRGAHTRNYQIDMAADGKGAKGGDVMIKTHAEGAAMSYGMRYLLKAIFNIAIGEEDTDGNITNGDLEGNLERIEKADTMEELKAIFREVYTEAEKNKAKGAMTLYIKAKDEAKKRLGVKIEPQPTETPSEPKSAPQKAVKPVSDHNWAKLHASAKERGIGHDEIASYYRKRFKVEHGRDLTPVQFKLVCDEVGSWKGSDIRY